MATYVVLMGGPGAGKGTQARKLEKKLKELEETKKAMLNILEDQDEVNKELYATREQLQEKVEKMEIMDKKKDELLSITAHELKTPITSIKGFTDLLKNDKIMNDEKKRKKYFDIIIDETTRIANLVSDILDLSRLDLGTFKFEYEQTNVKEVIEELRKMTEVMIRQKGLNIKYSVEDVDMVTDASRLVQVLANLVNNAIKYTEQGSITVEAFKEGEFVHFRVKDTGKGIAKKDLPNVFDRFYQADSSYTRKVGGTGLGLSISKGIVEHLGGEIWVHSKFGKGTVFEFTVKQKILKGLS